MKALIAEDTRVGRRVLSGVLTHHCDFEEVVEAEDGLQAVEAVGKTDFDLILLDWNMPEMDGIDALRAIREMGKNTPIIMVTGEKARDHVLAAFEAGANDYIVKPFGPKLLADKIAQTLEGSSQTKSRRPTSSALVADDSSVIRKLLAGMLEDKCGFTNIVQAKDGADALKSSKLGDFDIIFLDWNMPEMLGIDVLRAIRKTDKTTPIVMVTSEKEGARVVEALDAGANNYIIKPFEPSLLASKIKQVLRLYG